MSWKKRVLIILLIVMALAVAIGLFAYFFGGFMSDSAPAVEDKEPPKPTIGSIYYYEEDRYDRYMAYKEANPDMSDEDVVWKVNVDLDMPFYKDVNVIEDPNDINVLVNKYNKLPKDYEPEDMVSLDVSGTEVRKEVAENFNKMRDAAAEAGEDFFGQSGYRSYGFQGDIYDNYLKEDTKEGVDTYSARPRYSEHHTGLAIDLNVGTTMRNLRSFEGSTQADWVRDNAADYGFIVRYKKEISDITGYIDEPWHIRYIGEDHAKKMLEEDIASYEEYWTKYIDHTPPEEKED